MPKAGRTSAPSFILDHSILACLFVGRLNSLFASLGV